MANLQSEIHALSQELAQIFATRVMTIIQRNMGLTGGEVPIPFRDRKQPVRARRSMATTPKPAKGRLQRRTADEIEKIAMRIATALKAEKSGLGSEKLQAALKLNKREIGGPLAVALSKKLIRKRGEKRATKYFAT